jgi:hypothetical protein
VGDQCVGIVDPRLASSLHAGCGGCARCGGEVDYVAGVQNRRDAGELDCRAVIAVMSYKTRRHEAGRAERGYDLRQPGLSRAIWLRRRAGALMFARVASGSLAAGPRSMG